MRRILVLSLALIAAPASAQVVPLSWPTGVTPVIFGSPASAVNGSGQIPAGTGGAVAGVCGTLTVSTTQAGTGANTNETTLWSYALPANTLDANGKAVRITVFGSLAANGNNKTLRVKFGATTLSSVTTAGDDRGWQFTSVVIRTGASAQVGYVVGGNTDATNFLTTPPVTPAESTAGAITIAFTGQNGTANANDIVFRGALVECLTPGA